MKLTDKHHDIIQYIHQQPRSKAEIIERFKVWYRMGKFASKYIPVMLNALVKNGDDAIAKVTHYVPSKQLHNDFKNRKK